MSVILAQNPKNCKWLRHITRKPSPRRFSWKTVDVNYTACAALMEDIRLTIGMFTVDVFKLYWRRTTSSMCFQRPFTHTHVYRCMVKQGRRSSTVIRFAFNSINSKKIVAMLIALSIALSPSAMNQRHGESSLGMAPL